MDIIMLVFEHLKGQIVFVQNLIKLVGLSRSIVFNPVKLRQSSSFIFKYNGKNIVQ